MKKFSNQSNTENLQNAVVSSFQREKKNYNKIFCIEIDTNAELNAGSFLCAYLHSYFKLKRYEFSTCTVMPHAAEIPQLGQCQLVSWNCISQYKYWSLGISERDAKLSPLGVSCWGSQS